MIDVQTMSWRLDMLGLIPCMARYMCDLTQYQEHISAFVAAVRSFILF